MRGEYNVIVSDHNYLLFEAEKSAIWKGRYIFALHDVALRIDKSLVIQLHLTIMSHQIIAGWSVPYATISS